MLRHDSKIPELSTPKIYFLDTLYNCKYAMLHYRHGKIDPMTSKEVVCDDGKDFADCIRYAVMSRAKFYDYSSRNAGHDHFLWVGTDIPVPDECKISEEVNYVR